MKRVLLTGSNGTVAHAMKNQLDGTYDISGMSIPRMDGVIADLQGPVWQEQMNAYRTLVMDELRKQMAGQTAVVHLGWNTTDENWQGGIDPLNILVVDCVYQVAIELATPRIYMASSVHAYNFNDAMTVDADPIEPFPDTRNDPFGQGTTSLYGVSKRWMEISGQFYAERLGEKQKILCVRLGAVNRNDDPGGPHGRLWNSHKDLAGLLSAFIECADDVPNYWVEFGVSDNHGGEFPRPIFATTNPYGFQPTSNAWLEAKK